MYEVWAYDPDTDEHFFAWVIAPEAQGRAGLRTSPLLHALIELKPHGTRHGYNNDKRRYKMDPETTNPELYARIKKFGMHDRVRDTVHGITGVVMGVIAYSNGCVQFLVERLAGNPEESTEVKGTWIDDSQLELIAAVEEAPAIPAVGGPRRDA